MNDLAPEVDIREIFAFRSAALADFVFRIDSR